MQQQSSAPGSEDLTILTKEKAMETFKVQQEISMDQMETMMKDGMGGMNPQSQEG